MCVDANASQDAVGRLDHSGSSLRVDSGDGRVRQASSTSSSRATHEGNNTSGASTTGSDPGEDRIGRSVLRGLIAIGGGECHLRLKAGCLAPASSLGHSCPQDVSTYIGIYPQATCTIPGVHPPTGHRAHVWTDRLARSAVTSGFTCSTDIWRRNTPGQSQLPVQLHELPQEKSGTECRFACARCRVNGCRDTSQQRCCRPGRGASLFNSDSRRCARHQSGISGNVWFHSSRGGACG